HGISFLPGQPYRHATPATRADILRVPLFIKKPGQTSGEISDRNVQTIDVLPTIAHVLGAPLPWSMDGQSAFGASESEPRAKVFFDQDHRFLSQSKLDADYGGLKRKLDIFGSGSASDLYRMGGRKELIGQPADKSLVMGVSDIVIQLDDPQLFARVN